MHNSKQEVRPLVSSLIAGGGLLILVGILVLIFSSWNQFSGAGRVATVLLPLLALYLSSALTWRQAGYQEVSRHLLLLANWILPFVAGVVIFQSGLYRGTYNTADTTLVFLATFITVIAAAISEFALQERRHSLLVVIASSIAVLSFTQSLDLAWSATLGFMLVLGLFFIAMGKLCQEYGREHEDMVYVQAGTVLAFLTLLGLPLSFISDNYTSTANDLIVALGYPAAACIALALAIHFSFRWRADRDRLDLLQSRQALEGGAGIAFTLPATLIAISWHETPLILILLLLAIFSVSLSYAIKVSSFRLFGWVGVLVSLALLITNLVQELAAYWPLILVGSGVALIALALIITHLEVRSIRAWFFSTPEHSLWHLGETPVTHKHPTHTSHQASSEPHNGSETLSWIIIVLGAFFLLAIFL